MHDIVVRAESGKFVFDKNPIQNKDGKLAIKSTT